MAERESKKDLGFIADLLGGMSGSVVKTKTNRQKELQAMNKKLGIKKVKIRK